MFSTIGTVMHSILTNGTDILLGGQRNSIISILMSSFLDTLYAFGRGIFMVSATLGRKNPALGAAPQSVLETEAGINEVKKLLATIGRTQC